MADAVIQIRRTLTPNGAPANGSLVPGALSVEMATQPMPRLWVGTDPALAFPGNRRLVVDPNTLGGRPISTTAPTNGQVLAWNAGANQWEATASTAGTVTSVTAGNGLATTPAGGITGTGSIALTAPVSLANGGTNATDAAGARTQLGITQANLGGPFLPLTGGTLYRAGAVSAANPILSVEADTEAIIRLNPRNVAQSYTLNAGQTWVGIENAAGDVWFGTAPAAYAVSPTVGGLFETSGSLKVNGPISVDRIHDTVGEGGVLELLRSRGPATAPTAVQSGDFLGAIYFSGRFGAGNNTVPGATIISTATQAWTATNRGSNLFFEVTANNTTGRQPAMVINHDRIVSVWNGTQMVALPGGILEPSTAGNFLRTNTGTWVGGLPLTGGTINPGPVTITHPTAAARLNLTAQASDTQLIMTSPVGQNNSIAGFRPSGYRWSMLLGDTSAEAGANAGSNFQLQRWSDAGAYIDTPIRISRATGDVTFSGNVTAANFPSERQFKEDITGYSRGLEAIRALTPVSWKWNGRGGLTDQRVQYGVIAEDTEAVLPEAIGYRKMLIEDAEVEVRTLDDKPVLYALVNAVRELAAEVAQLRPKTKGAK